MGVEQDISNLYEELETYHLAVLKYEDGINPHLTDVYDKLVVCIIDAKLGVSKFLNVPADRLFSDCGALIQDVKHKFDDYVFPAMKLMLDYDPDSQESYNDIIITHDALYEHATTALYNLMYNPKSHDDQSISIARLRSVRNYYVDDPVNSHAILPASGATPLRSILKKTSAYEDQGVQYPRGIMYSAILAAKSMKIEALSKEYDEIMEEKTVVYAAYKQALLQGLGIHMHAALKEGIEDDEKALISKYGTCRMPFLKGTMLLLSQYGDCSKLLEEKKAELALECMEYKRFVRETANEGLNYVQSNPPPTTALLQLSIQTQNEMDPQVSDSVIARGAKHSVAIQLKPL